MKQPKTLQQAIIFFSEPGNCLAYMIRTRWPDGVECPTCGRKDVVFLANQNKWQCKSVHHHRQFTVKVGTIFEDSPIPLDKWLVAVWMITSDMEELLGMSDRVIVMHEGRVAGELSQDRLTEEAVMRLATGGTAT